jgi:hypothetical protein
MPLGVVGSSKRSPSEYWVSSIDKETFEGSEDIASDSLGNIFHLGFDSDTLGNMILIKYDSFGEVVWLKEYNCSGSEGYGISLKIDSSNNLYIVGTAFSTNASRLDHTMFKLDNNGNIIWQKALYDGTNSYNAFHLDVGDIDNSGNFYGMSVTTLNPGPNINISDRKIIKLNSSGSLQTQRHVYYSSTRELSLTSMIANRSTSEIYASGDHNADGFTTSVPIILKTDSSLSSVSWSRELQLSAGYGSVTSTSIDSSGNTYSTFYFTSPSTTSGLVKFNSSGTVQWQRQTSSASGAFWMEVYAAPDGFIYVYGRDQAVSNRLVIFKYNSNGVLQWQRYIDNAGYVYVLKIGMDPNGKLLLTADRDNSGNYNLLTIRLPADGSLTGTHGSYVYGTGSYTETSYSGTWNSSSVSLQNPSTYSTTLSISNANYVSVTPEAYTQKRTDIR